MGGRTPYGIITLVLIEGDSGLVSDHFVEEFDGFSLASGDPRQTVAAFDRATDALLFALQVVKQHREAVRIAVVTHEMNLVHIEVDQWAFQRANAVIRGAFDGMVLVSSGTREVLRGYSDDFGLMMLGRYHLPDVERPETLYRLTHRSIPSNFPRPTRFTEAPNNLPSLGGAFRGRELEMNYLVNLTRESRKIALIGPAGIGKSRLAVAYGQDCLEQDFDGVWFVDLQSAVEVSERLVRLTADRIGATPNPDRTPIEQIIDRLSGLNCLLIFDGCEVALEAVADLVPKLTAECPNLMVLMTSQEPIPIDRLSRFDISPLSGGVDGDAVDLFIDRVTLSDPQFDPDDKELARIAAICERLANVPMAIEVVAPQYHATKGKINLELLPLYDVRETLDWIVDHMTPAESNIAHAAAVFRGPIHREAILQVANTGTDDDLDSLCRKAMLVPDGAGSYQMANAIREYFAEVDPETHEDMQFEHAAWFNEYAQRAGKVFDETGETAAFADDIDNFHQALDSICRRRDADRAFEMGFVLFDYWYKTQRYGEGVYWLDRAIEVTKKVDTRARLMNMAASMCMGNADYVRGNQYASEGITLAQKAKRNDLLARLYMNSGLLLYGQENYKGALAAMNESRKCAKKKGESTEVPDLYAAAILAEMGRFDEAESMFAKINVSALHPVMRSYYPLRMGIFRIFQQRWNEAEDFLVQALIDLHRFQDDGGVRGAIRGLVIVYANIGMAAMSAKFIGICDALSRTSVGFWPRKQRDLYNEAMRMVEDRLGKSMFTELRTEGEDASLDRVVIDLSLNLPPPEKHDDPFL